jgi:pimeloyl-ACP methyl ester carboxylesterase
MFFSVACEARSMLLHRVRHVSGFPRVFHGSWSGGPTIAAVAIALAAAIGPARGQEKDDKIPEPADVTLATKDRVNLVATFYPGTKGQETVPVIMLHMRTRSRADYHDLALALQSAGHAVLVPDLRGHGDSPLFTEEGQKRDVERLAAADFQAMGNDVEACKSFLMERNNEGELNIDKLCIVGAELGAIVAMNWAAVDWSFPPLAVGKQGQWVKALVLLSPSWTIKGYSLSDALASPAVQRELDVYILSGKKETSATRIEKALGRYRADGEEKNLVIAKLNTSLVGTKILESAELKVADRILTFIERTLVERTIPWKDRSK